MATRLTLDVLTRRRGEFLPCLLLHIRQHLQHLPRVSKFIPTGPITDLPPYLPQSLPRRRRGFGPAHGLPGRPDRSSGLSRYPVTPRSSRLSFHSSSSELPVVESEAKGQGSSPGPFVHVGSGNLCGTRWRSTLPASPGGRCDLWVSRFRWVGDRLCLGSPTSLSDLPDSRLSPAESVSAVPLSVPGLGRTLWCADRSGEEGQEDSYSGP